MLKYVSNKGGEHPVDFETAFLPPLALSSDLGVWVLGVGCLEFDF